VRHLRQNARVAKKTNQTEVIQARPETAPRESKTDLLPAHVNIKVFVGNRFGFD
jgi:hypothetical protein